MIVCSCRAVSHQKVLSVIQEGAKSVDDVTRRCGAGGDCGSCVGSIERMIERGDGQERPGGGGGCRAPQAQVHAAV